MKWKFIIGCYIILVKAIYGAETAAVTANAVHQFDCSQPPKFGNSDISQCCRLPDINMGNAIKNCQEQIKSLKSHNSTYPVHAHVCYAECIYRETNSLTSDGDIDVKNVEKFLQTHVEQRDKIMVATIVESFRKCLTSIKQNMQAKGIKMFARLPEVGCSPYASMIYVCVNAETFLHCPAAMWQQNERSCNLAKTFTQQCDPLPHVPVLV